MQVLIIGAAGMIGRKVGEAIARTGTLGDRPVTALRLADVVAPTAPAGFAGTVETLAVDIGDPATAPALIASRPDVVIILAAIVSGEAEADFDKGYRINLDGTRWLLDAIRTQGEGYCPRVVFSSSAAVFGRPFPDQISDDFHLTPLTSYGTQKAMGELLVSDYSRRGFLDGVSLRLPTICIRPGKPNLAASSFYSGILREPLAGLAAKLPVPTSTRHWFASPRAAVGFVLHAATMDTGPIGPNRALTMPGLSATVGDQIEALRRVAGDAAVALIEPVEDPAVAAIVGGWAQDFEAKRATDLGFKAESSFDEIIRIHIEDELGGSLG